MERERARRQSECQHDWEFLYTSIDWYDGDEEDIYECKLCHKRDVHYTTR